MIEIENIKKILKVKKWNKDDEFDNWWHLNEASITQESLFDLVKEILKDKIEFGQVVGSIGWAYEVAKLEGEVWQDSGIPKTACKAVIDGWVELSWESSNNKVQVIGCDSSNTLTGWYRKVKTAKEELIESINNNKIGCTIEEIKEVLEKYEVTKK